MGMDRAELRTYHIVSSARMLCSTEIRIVSLILTPPSFLLTSVKGNFSNFPFLYLQFKIHTLLWFEYELYPRDSPVPSW
jgi:hypothetical protein